MAWIESHQGLEKHPKILHLSQLMGWSLDETLGRMHRIWWWCLDYAPTGDLRAISPCALAAGIGLLNESAARLLPALMKSRLVCRQSGTRYAWRVHDWIDYAGRYLRDTKFKRTPEKYQEVMALYAEPCSCGVSRLSADNQPTISRQSAVPNQPTNQPTNQASADTRVTHIEFEEVWQCYPWKAGKQEAEKAWEKSIGTRPALTMILSALEKQKRSTKWTKDNGEYIPRLSTWLNQARWQDELEVTIIQPATTVPKSFQKVPTDTTEGEPMPEALRTRLSGMGKAMPS